MRQRGTRIGSNGQRGSNSDWMADFETTTDPDDCRVWAWGMVDIFNDDSFEYGTTLAGFFVRLARMNARVYFHNLGFDGRFILDYLLNEGYVLRTGERVRLRSKEFSSLISGDGKFYSITVRWSSGCKTEFRDSLKKLPMSVDKVAKSFNMEIRKGSIDYDAPRPLGHVLTADEVDYLRNDVEIPAAALRQQLAAGMTRLTVGSDSLAEYKKLVGSAFDHFFPILSQSMDAEIRRAYRGGWTYADTRYRGKVVRKPVRVYDVNSLYPSVMYDRVLPYGEPVWETGRPKATMERPLFVTTLTLTAKLKPGHVPCIQIKSNPFFMGSVYQTEIAEPTTLTCSNVDLALWEQHYDLDIVSWEGSWMFRGVSGLFQEYIDKWMEVKKNSTGGFREIAKLHLNSLYGKFATNPDVTPKLPFLKDGVVHLELGDKEMRDPVYTPMGVFITAYAREVTIRAAQENYDSFAYADTDSLHLFTEVDPPGLDIDPYRLGAWKHEGNYQAAIYVRAKCYTEQHYDGVCTCKQIVHTRGCGYDTHIAGLPVSIASQVEFHDYYNGHTFTGKLVPKSVPGGVVLTHTEWQLRDVSLQGLHEPV